MKSKKLDIHVYAGWQGMPSPQPIGILSHIMLRGGKHLVSNTSNPWIDSQHSGLIDPEINFTQVRNFQFETKTSVYS